MKPAYQTRLGFPLGNCLQACVASIFETDIREVPDFPAIIPDGGQWIKMLQEWLHPFGLFYVEVPAGEAWAFLERAPEKQISIAYGKSPRGLDHAVVCEGYKIIHDPHPEGGGLEKIEGFGFFVPINPLRVKRELYDKILENSFNGQLNKVGKAWEELKKQVVDVFFAKTIREIVNIIKEGR